MESVERKILIIIAGMIIFGVGLKIYQNNTNNTMIASEVASIDDTVPMINSVTNVAKGSVADNVVYKENDALNNDVSPKIIRNYSINYETKNIDKTLEILNENTISNNGEIVNLNYYTSGDNNRRTAYMTVRIPYGNHEKFLNKKDEVGIIISLNSSADDITTEYIDIETRLTMLKSQQKRLQELSEVANSVEELLTIEDKLYQVDANIQSYASQIEYLKSVTDNVSINIYVEEVVEYSDNVSFGQRINDAFTNGFNNFTNFIKDSVVNIVSITPFILSGLGVTGIAFVIYKKLNKNTKTTKR